MYVYFLLNVKTYKKILTLELPLTKFSKFYLYTKFFLHVDSINQ